MASTDGTTNADDRDQARLTRVRRGTALRRHPTWEVIGLSIGLLCLAGALIALLPDFADAQRPSPGWAIVLLAAGFGATLLTVFRIEFRENAILFSLSEIPLVFALVFFDPMTGIATRLVSSALVFALIKRPPLHKQLFNLSLFVFETSVAYLIVRELIGGQTVSDLELIVAATAAVTAAGTLGSVAVALAVSRFVGDTLRHIVDELKAAWVLVVNGAMAGALLSLYLLSQPLAVFAVIPVVAMWYMMRRHGELAQQLRDLHAIHGFAGRIGRTLDLDDIGHSAVSEASRLLRAEMSVLAVMSSDGSVKVYATDGFPTVDGQVGVGDWIPLFDGGPVDVTTGTHLAGLGFDGFRRCGDVVVAPVDDEIGVIGVLVMARLSSSGLAFSDDDIERAQNLADQLASSLRRSMLHRRIQHEARHDALTGLPNRLSLQHRLATVAGALGPDEGAYVMMMDLDRFKEVNDTLGHHAGDDLLIEFTRRVSAQIGPDDFFARLAGDEFAVVAYGDCDDDVSDLARACIASAAEPVTLDGLSIVITASVGIARIRPGTDDPDLALRQADIAMYDAKSQHFGVELFRPELDRRTPARLSMLGDLRQAIENGDIDVEYQPKLDLASGLITGAEALARWTHHARGEVPPADFVRVAEDTGLIKQLTDIMLARGIAELRHLHDRGHQLSLSVNLSTHDLLDANLAGRAAGYLSAHQVDPGCLTLEITESSLLVEAPRTRATIHELHELGIRLSIDDFGTGYSSLSYLRQLPVSELKVDQSFIANMLIDTQDEVIVRSTIDLGHNLGLEVVAEGVENEQILDQLRSIRCDVAQGFAISRPLNAQRLLAWLHTTKHPSRKFDPILPEPWVIDPRHGVLDVAFEETGPEAKPR